MKSRSWLIVPGNSEERLGGALASGADIVVVDLDDTVPAAGKARARLLAAQWLAAHRQHVLEQPRPGRWVRLHSLEAGCSREDLAAIMPGAPDGLILPKAAGPQAIRQLAAEVYEMEQRFGIPANSTRIMPVVGETPQAAMRIADYCESAHQRLSGLTWNAAGLCASLGGLGYRESSGTWPDAARFVRAQALLAAHAGGVVAIEAPREGYGDLEQVRQAVLEARSDGFSGMFAVHPAQIQVINAGFIPSPQEVAKAQAVVDAFETGAAAGAFEFEGRVLDRSHLDLARRTIGAFEREGRIQQGPRPDSILRPA